MTPLATLATRGDALEVIATSAELADHHWQRRRELVRLAGVQRLSLLVDLPGCDRLELSWSPGPLPAALPVPGSGRRRFPGLTPNPST